MVSVDASKCIGCGLCVQVCGEVFEMGENNKAKVKEQKDIPCVKEAKESCPVDAIRE